MKRIICAALAVLCMTYVSAAADYTDDLSRIIGDNRSDSFFSYIELTIGSRDMVIDGKTKTMKYDLILSEDNTMAVPYEFIGCYDAEYYENGDSFQITQGDMTVYGIVGSDEIIAAYGGESSAERIKMSKAAERINGRVYMPLRSVIENIFGGHVAWNEEKQSILLTRPYQSKRILIKCVEGSGMPAMTGYKEMITNQKNLWVVQYDMATPDLKIKNICDGLKADNQNIEYAEPDIVMQGL